MPQRIISAIKNSRLINYIAVGMQSLQTSKYEAEKEKGEGKFIEETAKIKSTSLNEIVQENLILMISNEEGGMRYTMGFESIGGNAGTNNENSCMAINFRYQPLNGKIEIFGNIQDLQREMILLPEGTFRIETIKRKGDKILKYRIGKGTSIARKNMKTTIREYNRRCGV